MSRRKPRTLRSEEAEIWAQVAKTARPMHSKRPKPSIKVSDQADGNQNRPQPVAEFRIEPFRVGSRATTALSEGPASPSSTPSGRPALNMDRATFQKMKRGKVRPEARIDLHGMTADAAHNALTAFLFHAHASGKRLVLVITGKGRPGTDDGPIPSRVGVLRRSLPEWLSRPPLQAIVQQATESHQRHGGSGAFYVYLRRAR
jgi:DNA-nicking Smr family endonuclease